MDRAPLEDAIDGWLAHGPLSVEELAERAVDDGLIGAEPDEDDLEALDHIYWVLERSNGYWTTNSLTSEEQELVVLVGTFIESGMTFTHRVTAAELERGDLEGAPDLSVVLWEAFDGLPFDDGSGEVKLDYFEEGSSRLVGPSDWIEAVKVGDLLAFTRTDRVLSVEVIGEGDVGDGAAETEALREMGEVWIGDGQGCDEVPLVMEAMARTPGLFRAPVPPVGELLAGIGLERRGHEWGPAGEEWQTLQERFSGDNDATIRRRYRFDSCCDAAYDRVKDAWREHLRGEAVDGRALARDLGHGSVVEAFVHAKADRPTEVAQFASALTESSSGRRSAPALTLLGLARLREPDPEGAYQALSTAVQADYDLPVAAGALALLELDRGNLSRAHTLAVQSGEDSGLLEWIDAERARQGALRPSAGRNDPCPCGSGKKFKRCHADGRPLTLPQRVPFVVQRLGHYASGPDGHDALFGLAISAAGDHDDVAGSIRRFLTDSFLIDVVVHEGGLAEEYLGERGPLVADDEVALLESILDEPRRLWEITAVRSRESITLRDTGSGDEVTVNEHKGTDGREPGELLLARTVPVEGEVMLVGVPLLVPLRQRARVMRMLDDWADADTLAVWYGSLHLPPRITNREGEELVALRTVCEVDDAEDAVATVLDETFDRRGGELVWNEMFAVDAHDRVVRGTLSLEGSILTVESNSEERQERLLDTLDELFEYSIVEGAETDGLDVRDDVDGGGWGPGDLDGMPEEVRALLEQNMREREQRWVDESIPALDGLTPRQARDDPTRREDLYALLREMRALELPGDAVGMSVDRVERLLGIERG